MDTVRFRLRIFALLFILVLLAGVVGFMFIEGLSPSDALYFSIVTITTVGYGDIHPATPYGKILAIALIITGVGTFTGVIANVTEMLMEKRAKKERIQKLNMVIGVFFSELGTKILSLFSKFDPDLGEIRDRLVVQSNWSQEDFALVRNLLMNHRFKVDPLRVEFEELRDALLEKRNFLLRLLENPLLLEHEAFTEVLRAVFHLKEELITRKSLSELPESDKRHLGGDINRAYDLLVGQWLDYMNYLKKFYPYLFSHAMRTNPFDLEASPIVLE